ncbi:MAG: chaB [Candidatus Saccharibacteria bacterium]|nr:chaB [Candidatus Saccharibacteria bacterium]
MPFKKVDDLPENVKRVLPDHAQDIYKAAFNSAYDEYKNPQDRGDDVDREGVSHRVAWAAVKHKYQKGDDGQWHPIE